MISNHAPSATRSSLRGDALRTTLFRERDPLCATRRTGRWLGCGPLPEADPSGRPALTPATGQRGRPRVQFQARAGRVDQPGAALDVRRVARGLDSGPSDRTPWRAERCPSGRRCLIRNQVCPRGYQGFESPSLRQQNPAVTTRAGVRLSRELAAPFAPPFAPPLPGGRPPGGNSPPDSRSRHGQRRRHRRSRGREACSA